MIAAHSLAWKAPAMKGVSFWYFETRQEAEKAAKHLQPGSTYRIEPCLIPEINAHLVDLPDRTREKRDPFERRNERRP